jgi:DNA modification methylase
MVEMWDGLFAQLSKAAGQALENEDALAAFEAMHLELDAVWRACAGALVPGGIACINIGDATRTIDGCFQLFPNQARIVAGMMRAGFLSLPDILWRKPTNAPNKFMGSGMLPAGAYVTYEHEYVLVFRKGNRRSFSSTEDRENRRRSAYFWEERNRWFSDLWTDVRGVAQELEADTRTRSAAFPTELAFRLIQMYSVQADVVLDPFLGTGTTALAALGSGRSSVGVELDENLVATVTARLATGSEWGAQRARARLQAHLRFVEDREALGKVLKHESAVYGFAVMTGQETSLALVAPTRLERVGECAWTAECATVSLPER